MLYHPVNERAFLLGCGIVIFLWLFVVVVEHFFPNKDNKPPDAADVEQTLRALSEYTRAVQAQVSEQHAQRQQKRLDPDTRQQKGLDPDAV
jgi:hypothetical protein